MNAFTHHFAFEFKTGLRNPTAMLMNYLFPIGFYAMMGLVMVQINPGFSQNLLPAMIVFFVMVGSLLGLPGPLVESREAGIYRSFKINGVPAVSILAIPTLTTIIHALIGASIVALTAGPLFKGLTPDHWGNLALITLLTAVTMGAFGALIGVIASGSRSTVLWSQLIFLPSMLLGGMMMPLDILPASVRPISYLLPSTHAMQAFQALAFGKETLIAPWISVPVLLSSAILALGLAIYLFTWDSHNSSRRGHPVMALLVMLPYAISIFLN